MRVGLWRSAKGAPRPHHVCQFRLRVFRGFDAIAYGASRSNFGVHRHSYPARRAHEDA